MHVDCFQFIVADVPFFVVAEGGLGNTIAEQRRAIATVPQHREPEVAARIRKGAS